MKNKENAASPISAMAYWSSRTGPLRRSGRPEQTSFSDAIRESSTLTTTVESETENRHKERVRTASSQIEEYKNVWQAGLTPPP